MCAVRAAAVCAKLDDTTLTSYFDFILFCYIFILPQLNHSFKIVDIPIGKWNVLLFKTHI